MSGEVTPTIHGRVYEDPQLRSTPRGTPVVRFRVLSVPREYDPATAKWRDGEPVFIVCTAWGRLAQHVAASVADRVHVIVTGQLTACDEQLHLNANRVGIDLDAHVAYIDATLPAVLAGKGRKQVRAGLTQPPREQKTAAAPESPAVTRPLPYRGDEQRSREWAEITAPRRPRSQHAPC